MFYKSDFKPAWWLRNPHLQTMAAKFFRRNLQANTEQETLELPDGDFIDLAWTEIPDKDNTKPIVVLLHGLEGSINSHYAKGMITAIEQRGWIGVLMHFRGCSGRPNRQGASYHSGDTRDIHTFTQQLRNRFSHCPFAIIGFSLGGNVLTRYLAEKKDNPYKVAAVICAPIDLSSCCDRINRGFSKIYQKFLIGMLKRSVQIKMKLKLVEPLLQANLKKIKTIRQFDQHFTAPLNNFQSAEDYYTQASGKGVLGDIHQPCLLIHASDDPFLSHADIISSGNLPDLPKNMRFEVCLHGGHVGFIAGNNPFKPQYWLEQRVPSFLEQHL